MAAVSGAPSGHGESSTRGATAPSSDSESSTRGATLWLGGVLPDWNESHVHRLFQPFTPLEITIRRKGWRDEAGNRVGFALVRLGSEALAEEALERLSELTLRPHRWARPAADDAAAGPPTDPTAPLLASLPPPPSSSAGASSLAGMPSLEEQFAPLTISQARERLCAFGCEREALAVAEAAAQRHGGRVAKKQLLVDSLCALHRARPDAFPRRVRHAEGAPLAPALLAPLLEELRATRWPRKRRNVTAAEYLVLGAPVAGCAPKPLGRFARLWELAVGALHSLAPHYEPTSIALTHNFVGTPHVDAGDTCPQHALSLGDFAGGGELCVEASPTELVLVDTRNRLACVDGRFIHFVRGYEGERWSVIFYRVEPPVQPPTAAVHEVGG